MSIASNFPAIKPTLLLDFANTEELDSRVTFTRASTATYYGTQTAKAEENLIAFSQEFETGNWGKTNITVTGNTVAAPDGTTTAETFAETSATGGHFIEGGSACRFQSISGSVYAFSIFLKKGAGATAPDIMQFTYGNAGFAPDVYVNFNLNAGTVSASGAGASNATITSVGNGWYRCSFTATSNASTSSTASLFFVNNNGSATRAPSYAGATTADVYAWGVQVEQRSSVTAYTATTTQTITNYIPVLETAASGVARFDHNPTTFESLGLEIEESRTNLQVYSSEFDNAAWGKTNATITADTIVAPDGTLTGDKLVEDTATGEHAIGDGFVFTSGTTYTGTIYAKKAERTLCRFGAGSTATWPASIIVDLSNGTITSTVSGSGTVTDVGNGWYRISVTGTAAATASTNFGLRLVSTGTTISYTGDGYSGIYIWGAQLEAGAFATSYIPTVASQVTRAADTASMTGTNFSSWYNQAQGCFYTEASIPFTTIDNRGPVRADDGGENNRIMMRNGGASSRLDGRIVTAGTSVTNLEAAATAITANTMFKAALAYKTDDFAMSVNNGAVLTDALGAVPVVNRLLIGDTTIPGLIKGSTIRKIAYYPVRIQNSQLQGLTS